MTSETGLVGDFLPPGPSFFGALPSVDGVGLEAGGAADRESQHFFGSPLAMATATQISTTKTNSTSSGIVTPLLTRDGSAV